MNVVPTKRECARLQKNRPSHQVAKWTTRRFFNLGAFRLRNGGGRRRYILGQFVGYPVEKRRTVATFF
jgi:hypothetical protein